MAIFFYETYLAEILCGTSELFKGAIIVCKKNHQGYTEELSLAFGPLVYLFILMLVFISFKNNKGNF